MDVLTLSILAYAYCVMSVSVFDYADGRLGSRNPMVLISRPGFVFVVTLTLVLNLMVRGSEETPDALDWRL